MGQNKMAESKWEVTVAAGGMSHLGRESPLIQVHAEKPNDKKRSKQYVGF